MLEAERRLLKSLHLGFVSFGLLILVVSIGIQLANIPQASVTASTSGVVVDDETLSVDETYYSSAYTRVRIGPSVAVDTSNYSYAVTFTTTNGCTVNAANSSYVSSGTAFEIAQGAGSYSPSADIRIKGNDDSQIGEGSETCTAVFTMNTTHPGFDGDTATITLTVKDDDATPAIQLVKVSGPSALNESNPDSSSNTITYSLKTSDPSTDWPKVTITASNDCTLGYDLGGGKVGGGPVENVQSAQLTLTHSYTKEFYVRAVDDSDKEGNHTCTLTYTNSTTDPEYSSIKIPKTTISITDNDTTSTSSSPDSSTTSDVPQSVEITPITELPAVEKVEDSIVAIVDESGREIETSKDKPATLDISKPIVVSGKTIPNGIVKLYIFSEPQEATVTADDEGNWAYTIESIEEGSHRVEMEVTDPETGEVSERTEVLAFNVAQIENADTETSAVAETPGANPADEGNPLVLIAILSAAVVAVVGGAGYWWWTHKHKRAQPKTTQTSGKNTSDNKVIMPSNTDSEGGK